MCVSQTETVLTHSLAEPARGRLERLMAYKQPSSLFTHL